MAGSGFNIFIGGKLTLEPKLDYVGGKELLEWFTEPEWMCMKELKDIIDSLGSEGEIISTLYKRPHLSMSAGLNLLDNESDVEDMVKAWREDGAVNIYVVLDNQNIGGKNVKGIDDNVECYRGINVNGGNVVNCAPCEGSVENINSLRCESHLGLNREAAAEHDDEEEPDDEEHEDEVESVDEEELDDDEEEPDYGGESDDEVDLEDVGYGTDDSNGELNDYVREYKEFIINAVRRSCQSEPPQKNSSGDEEDSEYFDESSKDWSLSEVSGDDEANSNGENEVVHVRRKSRKIYYKPDRPDICLRTIFTNRTECRQAIIDYSVRNSVKIKFIKNDTRRVRAKCVVEGCPWVVYASCEKPGTELMVKTYVPNHNCSKTFENKFVTYKYLAKRYLPLFRAAPSIKVLDFRKIVKEQMHQSISAMKAYRTKILCHKTLVGDYNYEFSRLWSYAAEIGRTNLGSTVMIKHVRVEGEDKPRFQRMYICFAELRQGFLAACRPFIGLDGCFLKGVMKGQILVAVGRDGNNQMYPFAWAVVEKECKDYWVWFLSLLKSDIDTTDGAGFTLISDQQKGLNLAVEMLLPNSEHRCCARHIYANWRKSHPGRENQQIFWCCAKSTTIADFNQNVRRLDGQAQEDLLRVHPSHWCKAFFKTHSSCDIVDNNLTEAFNASIVEARHMPIISMLENIRRGVMHRVMRKVEQCKKWKTPICPRIRTKFENTRDISRWNLVLWGCDNEYEVNDNQDYYVVNMRDSTCTCRIWDLQGIPCRHVVAAMTYKNIDVYSHVSAWYNTQVFSDLYTKHHLKPMAGDRFWPESDLPPLTPPPFIKQTGRPKKKRIQEPGEGGTSTRVSRKGRILRCNECWLTGHNARRCPIVLKRRAEAAAAKAKSTTSSCITVPLKVSTGKRKREIEERKRAPGIQIHDTFPKGKRTTVIKSPQKKWGLGTQIHDTVPKGKRTTVIKSPHKKWGSNNVMLNKCMGYAKGASGSGVKITTRGNFPTQESRNG